MSDQDVSARLSPDRILNRDDLDDAFECSTMGNILARLFIVRRCYLVLELILGTSNVGNKVPHPEQRPISSLASVFPSCHMNLYPTFDIKKLKY